MDMDNSLNSQIMQQLNNIQMQNNTMRSVNDTQMQSVMNQMQQMQMSMVQQSMNPQSAPLSSIAPGVSGAINGFAQGQMQGVYNGLGITPELRSAFGNYVGSPVTNAAAGTVPLTSSLLMARYSPRTSTLTYDQRSELARNIAINSSQMTNTVVGGIGSIGKGAASLVGGAAVAGAIGWGPMFGLSMLGLGVKGLTTSQTAASLFGDHLGPIPLGWNKNVYDWKGHFSEELEETRGLESMLSRESYRFINPSRSNSIYGSGLSRREVHKWSKRIRGWDSKFGMEDADIQTLTNDFIDNGIINNVSDVNDFEKKFSKYVDYVKNSSKILGKSVKDISNMIAEFKQAGITTDNFDVKAAELKTYSSLLGKNIDSVKDFMLNSVKTYTQGTTLSGNTVSGQVMYNASLMNESLSNSKDRGNTALTDLINNNGGAMGASSVVRGGMEQVLGRGLGSTLMSAFFTPGKGGLVLNTDALRNAYNGVVNGTLNADELTAQARSNFNSWSDSIKREYLRDPRQFIMNQEETQLNKMLTVAGRAYKNTGVFQGSSLSETMQSIYGLDANTSKLLEANINTFESDGSRIALSSSINPLIAKSIAFRENLAYSKTKGSYWKSTAWLDNLADTWAINPTQSVQDKLEDIMNKRAGIPSEDITKHNMYRTDYDLSRSGMQRESIIDKINDNTLINKMSKIINNMPDGGDAAYSRMLKALPMDERTSLMNQYSLGGGYDSYYGGFIADGISSIFGLKTSSGLGKYAFNKYNDLRSEQFNAMQNSLGTLIRNGIQHGYTAYDEKYTVTNVTPGYTEPQNMADSTRSNMSQYDAYFKDAANRTGVNESILKAVGWQESNFTNHAMRNDENGITGIMQVSNKYYGQGIDLTDPQQNILKAAQILRDNTEKYGGNLSLGLASYNAGISKVTSAMKKAGYNYSSMGYDELANFDVSSILQYLPTETQNYIPGVMSKMNNMGYNSDSYVNQITKTRNIQEVYTDKKFIGALISGINNGDITLGKSMNDYILGTMSKDAGWIQRQTTEYNTPNSIDMDKLLPLTGDLQSLANRAVSKNGKINPELERSLGYFKYMQLMNPSDITEDMVKSEIQNLNSAYDKAGSYLSGSDLTSGRSTIKSAIQFLNAHSPGKTIMNDILLSDYAKSDIKTLISKGRQSVNLLDTSGTGESATDVRNKLLGAFDLTSSSLETISNKSMNLVSKSEITDLVANANKLDSILSKFADKDDAVSKDMKEILKQILGYVGDISAQKTKDTMQNVLESQAVIDSSKYGSVNIKSLEKELSGMNADSVGFIDKATLMYNAVETQKVDQKNKIDKGLGGFNYTKAIESVQSEINKIVDNGGSSLTTDDTKSLINLQTQQTALIYAQNNGATFDKLSSEQAKMLLDSFGDSATPGYAKQFYGNASNILKYKDIQDASNRAFGKNISKEQYDKELRSAIKEPARLVDTDYNPTELFDDYYEKIKTGQITPEDKDAIYKGSVSPGSQSAAYNKLVGLIEGKTGLSSGSSLKSEAGRDVQKLDVATKATMDKLTFNEKYDLIIKGKSGNLSFETMDSTTKDMIAQGFIPALDENYRNSKKILNNNIGIFESMGIEGLGRSINDIRLNSNISASEKQKRMSSTIRNATQGKNLNEAQKQALKFIEGEGYITHENNVSDYANAKITAGEVIKSITDKGESMKDIAAINTDAAGIILGMTKGLTANFDEIYSDTKGIKDRGSKKKKQVQQDILNFNSVLMGSKDNMGLSKAEYQERATKSLNKLVTDMESVFGKGTDEASKIIKEQFGNSLLETINSINIDAIDDGELKKQIGSVKTKLTEGKDIVDAVVEASSVIARVKKQTDQLSDKATESGKSVDSITQDYITKTDKYFDMVENRIRAIESRLQYGSI